MDTYALIAMPVLALDAGTTSTRALVFSDDGAVLSRVQRPFPQFFPRDGWVEHDADEIWVETLACAREALADATLTANDIAGIGIAVQRETVVVWERSTGLPIHRAIVWQDRRTAHECHALAADPEALALVARTGLLLDPYFSATKIAWLLDTTYALAGSIFNAGSIVQWLRDRLGFVATAAETAEIAASVTTSGGVYCVPAFTGLGAPWWDPDARAALVGMTRDSGRAEIVRAALESVAFQTRDLARAFAYDGVALTTLRVDGGMAANDWLMQTIADQLRVNVERPAVLETTAWGAARLAGLHAGIYPPLGTAAAGRVERTFAPSGDPRDADRLHVGWMRAVARARS